jgi:hypothetical protein
LVQGTSSLPLKFFFQQPIPDNPPPQKQHPMAQNGPKTTAKKAIHFPSVQQTNAGANTDAIREQVNKVQNLYRIPYTVITTSYRIAIYHCSLYCQLNCLDSYTVSIIGFTIPYFGYPNSKQQI